MRSFALTLHFHSARAYDYVRDKFNKNLPHVSTIRKWYSYVCCSCTRTNEHMMCDVIDRYNHVLVYYGDRFCFSTFTARVSCFTLLVFISALVRVFCVDGIRLNFIQLNMYFVTYFVDVNEYVVIPKIWIESSETNFEKFVNKGLHSEK